MLVGYQARVFNKISIDYYVGAGFRCQAQKAIRYYRKSWDYDLEVYTEDTDRAVNTMELFTPTIHLGISFGYFF